MPAAPVTPNSKNPLRGAVEIIPDRLYYCALKTPPASHKILLRNKDNQKVPVRCFCIDDELVYWNFFLDFGPLNLGQLYRFTLQLEDLLGQPPPTSNKNNVNNNKTTASVDTSNIRILFYSSTAPAKRANAIFLICAWQVLELQRTPEQAMLGFSYYQEARNQDAFSSQQPQHFPANSSIPPPYPLTAVGQATVAPLPPFHDASPAPCSYNLNIFHCLQGLIKAKQYGFFDWDSFDVDEYEYFEQVENGDLNWIVKDKILAFAGPSFKKTVTPEGYCTLAPSDYIPYFQSRNVGLVVRLNKKNYDERDFKQAGIDHLEQFYVDGSCPPMKILQRVLAAFEAVPAGKAFAVHCKAGLGRTGTCIGAYLMKHYRMTAPEVISWMRICRPGCVIGPQQQFLQDLEPIMWQEGDMLRIPSTVTPKPSKSRPNHRYHKLSLAMDTATRSSTDAVSGRPGQADGLLARRLRHTASPGASSSKPVPITPDGGNTPKTSPANAGNNNWVQSATT